MLKRFLAALIGVGASSAAMATVTLSFDIDPASVNGDGIVSADVFATISAGDVWTAGGVTGSVANGATLRYGVDPNTSLPVLTNPGTNHPNLNVTFFNKPRANASNVPLARNATGRFTGGLAAAAGRYVPTGPSAEFDASHVNVAYFASPPETAGSPSISNYIFRVSLNLPAGRLDSDVVVFGAAGPLAGHTVVFSSTGDDTHDGTASATFQDANVHGSNWGLALTPEPASLALLALGGLAMIRRR